MRYGSVCSGIEAASVAWAGLGWTAAFTSEIDPFPRAVLAHHYPTVPCHGDFATIKGDEYGPIDLLVGGTPCQSFSVAGLRAGLADDRGNLALEFFRLAGRTRPRWLVWENVPGVLSSSRGRDFGSILGGLVELGYGFAYRVLDAQYFGVPQRRRRVFVVGYLGDWRRAAAVLFERASMSGHPAPRRETGQRAAQCLAARTRGGGGLGTDAELDGALIAAPEVSPALKARDYKGPSSDGDGDGDGAPLIAHTLRGEGFDASEDGTGRGTPLVPVAVDHYNGALTGDVAATLSTGGATTTGSGPSVMVPVAQPYTLAIRGRGETHNLEYRQDGTANALITPNGGRGGIGVGAIAHAFDARQSDVIQYGDRTGPLDTDGHSVAVAFTQNQRDEVREVGVVGALAAEPGMKQQTYLATGATPMQVRRLTPRECERLQGFPDDYTAIPWRGKPASDCPDGPRYKALGNSMAVPVMRWIGERIETIDSEDGR